MRIRIKEVSPVQKEKNFFKFELRYEKDGKEEKPKPFFSFNEESYNVLKNAKPDEQYDVKLEKDGNGYWQWKNVALASAAGSVSAGGSTYQANDAKRQTSIVRQSSLAQSVAAGVVGFSIEEILERAEAFEAWVNRET